MQQIIQEITEKFIDRLPDNQQYYRPDDLRKWDFPSFLIRRINVELKRNLGESMIIPKTDWANTQSDAVLSAWQQFVEAIHAETRLPASYGKAVIETAVADIMEMLVQPRKNIPDVIYGSDDVLESQTLSKRLQAVVIYRHFAKLLARYMQKKDLDELSKSRCVKVIANADQKMTQRYSPLNWAQLLDTLFTLMGGEIDSELLRLFFEDKNYPRIARHFDLKNKPLSKAELIEELSSPELLDFEGYESEQPHLFGDQSKTKPSGNPKASTADSSADQQSALTDSVDDAKTEIEDRAEPGSIASNFAEQDETESEEKSTPSLKKEDQREKKDTEEDTKRGKSQDGSAKTTNETADKKSEEGEGAKPKSSSSSKETTDEAEKPAKELTTLDIIEQDSEPAADDEEEEKGQQDTPVKNEQGQEDDEQKEEESDAKQDPESTSDIETEMESENNEQVDSAATAEEEDENPMWMRFMSDEEIEEYRKKEESEDGFDEEPIIDLTKEDATDKETEKHEVNELKDFLDSDRDLFVEHIFGGSERAFDDALEDIAGYDSWSDVSKFIEKDVFKRNHVDMYSEAAVDLTDQLQTYFLDKENDN